RPGVVHALQKDEVVQVRIGQRYGGRERPADDHIIRVNRFKRTVRPAQQVGVLLRVDRPIAPFAVGVRLVPDLIVMDAPFVTAGDGGGVIHEVLVIVWRGFVAYIRVGVRPFGRGIQPRLDLQVVFAGEIDNVVVLFPGVDGVDFAVAIHVVA